MTTIYACPFCGHEDVYIGEVAITEYAVDCPECRAIGPICGDIMGAIAAWNGATLRTPDIAGSNGPSGVAAKVRVD